MNKVSKAKKFRRLTKSACQPAYERHKKNAKMRGIEFLLTLEEWYDIWRSSGQLKNRGCHKGQYVMARYNDVGPYAKWNVKIVTCSLNLEEAMVGNSFGSAHKGRINPFLGRKHTKQTKAKMRAALLGHKRSVGSWNGSAKISEEDVPKIRALYNEGYRQHKIAEIFGISQMMISYIVRGKKWRHVPCEPTEEQGF